MRAMRTVAIGVLLLTLGLPIFGLAEEETPKIWSGQVSAAAKYESNVDLLSDDIPEESPDFEKIDSARVVEVVAAVGYRSSWTSPWHLEASLLGLCDVFVESISDTWAVGRADLTTGVSFGANEFGVSSEARYFTEPDDSEFDNLRNNASTYYRRYLSDVWQIGVGYKNVVHVFPDSAVFNNGAHGGYGEIRSNWTPGFSTYGRYEGLYFQGRGEMDDEGRLGAPSRVVRHSGEAGFEAYFASRHALIGAYSYFTDDAEDDGASQIGEIQAEAENLESEAEFDLSRHKATMLYSVRLGERFALSFYNELQAKSFNQPILDVDRKVRDRDDFLWLTSTWLKARLTGELYGTARYLYRMNESSTRRFEFEDHIGLAGMEFRF